MQQNKFPAKPTHFIFLLIPLAVFISLVLRTFFTADLTDETQYVSWVQNIMNGGSFFSSDLFYQQVGSLLTAPFFMINRTITQSNDYLVLLNRWIYLFYLLTTSALFYLITSRVFRPKIALIASTILLSYVPFSVFSVSYNTIAVLLLNLYSALSFICIFRPFRYSAFALGGVGAMAVFFYPTLAIVIAITTLIQIVFLKWPERFSLFYGSTFVTTIAFIFYWSLGIDLLKESIQFTSAFGAIKTTSELGNYFFQLFFADTKTWAIYCFFVFLYAFLAWKDLFKNKLSFLAGALTLTPLVIGLFFFLESPYVPAHFFMNKLLAIIWPWITYIAWTERKCAACRWLYGQFILFFITSALFSWTSSNGLINAALGGCGAIIISFCILSYFHERLSIKATYIYGITLLAIFAWGNFRFTYRDLPLPMLITKITMGPYRGIQTGPERAQIINELNLTMNHVPMNSKITVLHSTSAPYMWNSYQGQTSFFYFFCADFNNQKIKNLVIAPMLKKIEKTDYLILFLTDGKKIDALCDPILVNAYLNSGFFKADFKTKYWSVYKNTLKGINKF